MKEKLLNLMKNEKLTQSRLAELLEIQPAGISHILAGRNKPGFDLLQKILRRFPQINPDWLLLDSTQMYRDHASATNSTEETSNLFGKPQQPVSPDTTSSTNSSPTVESEHFSLPPVAQKTDVVRVTIFYADQTFESFIPKNRA